MLYSPEAHVAFAHYPKTAGSSLTAWFRESLPDASYVDPDNCHQTVRKSLEQLGFVTPWSSRPRIMRECFRLVHRLAPERSDLRIVGVVREPFEMLISLYEYWRRIELPEEPEADLIRAARGGTFRQFLRLAVGERLLANYETYFDVGGPAWATTRLIDFQSLETGLEAVCREFGIDRPVRLQRINAGRRQRRDVGAYLAEAGALAFEVRTHFQWYYDEAVRIMVRGHSGPARLPVTA